MGEDLQSGAQGECHNTANGPWAGREPLGGDAEVKDHSYKGGGPALGGLVGLVSFQSPDGNLRTRVQMPQCIFLSR